MARREQGLGEGRCPSRTPSDILHRLWDGYESTDVEELLRQSREPISVLTELAASLGLRTLSKERKTELINRIATHITNQRGYRLLRGDDPYSSDAAFSRSVSRT